MTVIFFRSSLRFIFEISTPSISIVPDSISNILNRLKMIVDFPAPVLPTTPIFSFGLIFIFKFLRTCGSSARYLANTFLYSISPEIGQSYNSSGGNVIVSPIFGFHKMPSTNFLYPSSLSNCM